MLDPSKFLPIVAEYIQQYDRSSADKPLVQAIVNPNHTAGATEAKVTFAGESALSAKAYPSLGSYTPKANDRVVLAPVGNSFLIIGAVGSSGVQPGLPFAEFTGSGDSAGANAWSRIIPSAAGSNNTSGLVTLASGYFSLTKTGLWGINALLSLNSTASGHVMVLSIHTPGDPGTNGIIKALYANGSASLRLAGQSVVQSKYFTAGQQIGFSVYSSIADTSIAPTSIQFEYKGLPAA